MGPRRVGGGIGGAGQGGGGGGVVVVDRAPPWAAFLDGGRPKTACWVERADDLGVIGAAH